MGSVADRTKHLVTKLKQCQWSSGSESCFVTRSWHSVLLNLLFSCPFAVNNDLLQSHNDLLTCQSLNYYGQPHTTAICCCCHWKWKCQDSNDSSWRKVLCAVNIILYLVKQLLPSARSAYQQSYETTLCCHTQHFINNLSRTPVVIASIVLN